MLPSVSEIKKMVKNMDASKPIVILTPVNRYLGFSAPISPVDQFGEIASDWGVPISFKDPQRLSIKMGSNNHPTICDKDGEINGSVFFPFGHELLDRKMTLMIISALEKTGKKVVNGSKALTVADDKALTAIALAGEPEIPTPKSVITSARSDSKGVIDFLTDSRDEKILAKMSGYSAGGVGIQPLPADIDYLAPALWLSRMNNRPRVIQNDADQKEKGSPRGVIRSYIVGGKVVGSYTTNGYGIVNCAGLTRESKAKTYHTSKAEEKIFLKAAEKVGCSGFCRIDAAKGENLSIFEINPLARIDAEKYGLHIAEEILLYCIKLAINNLTSTD